MSSLPDGLSVCADCADIRGRTPGGRLSVCFCQGVVCNWCGARLRRSISDHYVARDGRWRHTPYFALGGHRCPPGTVRGTGKWDTLMPVVEQDFLEYRERMNQATYDMLYDVPPRSSGKPHLMAEASEGGSSTSSAAAALRMATTAD